MMVDNKMQTAPAAFCIACGCSEEYKIKSEKIRCEVRGIEFTYIEESACCAACGEPVYVPELNDRNAQAREDAYRGAAGLISVEEINQIMGKYHIGAEPLSFVMGFGKVAVTRYLTGKLPSKTNSDRLLEVLHSRKRMRELLQENGGQITEAAYRKCEKALDALDQLYSMNKIEVVTRYLLRHTFEITPLALQKLLYYAQSFYRALFGKELFPDPCYAWVHGPVYPHVYKKYKGYGYNPIEAPSLDTEETTEILNAGEKAFLDSVIAVFGLYSGRVLEGMTHRETPWLKAREGLAPKDRGHSVISKYEIDSYFQKICKEYGIKEPCDMKKYCDDALSYVRSAVS